VVGFTEHLNLNLGPVAQFHFRAFPRNLRDRTTEAVLVQRVHRTVKMCIRRPNTSFFCLIDMLDFSHGFGAIVFVVFHHA